MLVNQEYSFGWFIFSLKGFSSWEILYILLFVIVFSDNTIEEVKLGMGLK